MLGWQDVAFVLVFGFITLITLVLVFTAARGFTRWLVTPKTHGGVVCLCGLRQVRHRDRIGGTYYGCPDSACVQWKVDEHRLGHEGVVANGAVWQFEEVTENAKTLKAEIWDTFVSNWAIIFLVVGWIACLVMIAALRITRAWKGADGQ